MPAKRGQRVILKMGVYPPKNYDEKLKSIRTAFPGDEGRVISRTKNGWLRVCISRTGGIVQIRNGSLRIDKPFIRKVSGTWSSWVPSYAWWLPLTPEPWVLADKGDQGIWYDHKKGKLMGVEHCEEGGEHILFATKKTTDESEALKLGNLLETLEDEVDDEDDEVDEVDEVDDEDDDLITQKALIAAALDRLQFEGRTGFYSWGPQGIMGPTWGGSYTGD